MEMYVLYQSKNLAADINKKAGNAIRYMFPDDALVYVALESTDKGSQSVFKELAKYPNLAQEVQDICKEEYDKLVTVLAQSLRNVNNAAETDETEEFFAREFSKDNLEKVISQTIAAMVTQTEAKMESFQKLKDDYKKYKIKVVAGISLTTAGMAVSIALIASTPFHFGAGTVIGIWGIAKSSVALITMIQDGLQSVDDAIKEAAKKINKIEEKYEKSKKAHISAKKEDFAKSVFNELSKFFIKHKFFETLKEADSSLEKAQNKLAGLEIEWQQIGHKINKTLVKIDAIQAWQKEIYEQYKKDSKPLNKLKYEPGELKKLEEKLQLLIGKNDWFRQHLQAAKLQVSKMRASVDALLANQEHQQQFLDALEIALEVADAAIGAAGGASSWEGLIDATKDAVPVVGQFVIDKGVAPALEKAFEVKLNSDKKAFEERVKIVKATHK